LPIRIGPDGPAWDPTSILDGKMDEVRIANVGREAGWIQDQYNTMNQTAVTVGAEQSL